MSPSADARGSQVGSTERTTVRRLAEKTVTDATVRDEILDAGFVAHVSVSDPDGQPYVVPVAYARDGDRVLFHGSTGSRLFRGLAQGVPTCFTVTLLDGMVLARSAFESSMSYRAVMVLGSCVVLEGQEKEAALERVSDHLLPGQWDVIRHPTKKELAATLMLALSLDESSVKVSDGVPTDDEDDLVHPVYSRIWAGHVPLRESFGEPLADDLTPEGTPVPEHVKAWAR